MVAKSGGAGRAILSYNSAFAGSVRMRDFVHIHVNGKPHQVRGQRVFQSLSNFLRYDLGLTGTKVVCAEGDCGSCAVLVGRVHATEDQTPDLAAPLATREPRIVYRALTSCIQFVY